MRNLGVSVRFLRKNSRRKRHKKVVSTAVFIKHSSHKSPRMLPKRWAFGFNMLDSPPAVEKFTKIVFARELLKNRREKTELSMPIMSKLRGFTPVLRSKEQVCHSKKKRKRVLFALNKAGRGKMSKPHYTAESYIRCN